MWSVSLNVRVRRRAEACHRVRRQHFHEKGREAMERYQLLAHLQRYVANVGITASALRNQGASGIVKAARQFLAALAFAPLVTMQPCDYRRWLDTTTETLLPQLPEGARNWGAARKAINIFMSHAYLNRELAGEYQLDRLAAEMETPLDDLAAKALRKFAGSGGLPKWPGIRCLTEEVSDQYQATANLLSAKHDIPRACLDILLWRPEIVAMPETALSDSVCPSRCTLRSTDKLKFTK
jgi:hypothetical protein